MKNRTQNPPTQENLPDPAEDGRKYVYMEVTRDHLALPVAIADSVMGLSRVTGVSSGSILSHISRVKSGKLKGERFVKVSLEE